MQRVREAAEKAKIELSGTLDTSINLPYVTADQTGPKHLDMSLNRSKLEQMVEPIIEKCRQPMMQALADAEMEAGDVKKIILVGGPTRMPSVRDFVKKVIGTEPEGGIDPMECVALGAAIQGGVLAGEVKDILLLDVTPLSLGIETLGGVFTRLIDRNTTIPTRKSQVFSTAADNQTQVDIHVLQGEREMATGNTSIGRFALDGIPPAPRGIPQIEVTFDIDANGILNVTAKDMATGKEEKKTITAPQKLSEDEIQAKVKDAEKYAEEDKAAKDEAETLNQADTMVYTADKTLKELGDKVPEDQKAKIEEGKKKLAEALEAKDIPRIKTEMEEFQTVLHELSTLLYQQAQAEQEAQEGAGAEAPGGAGPAPAEEEEEKGEKVVDADYEVVDEDKE
jgi:molecular chaperone DnaK